MSRAACASMFSRMAGTRTSTTSTKSIGTRPHWKRIGRRRIMPSGAPRQTPWTGRLKLRVAVPSFPPQPGTGSERAHLPGKPAEASARRDRARPDPRPDWPASRRAARLLSRRAQTIRLELRTFIASSAAPTIPTMPATADPPQTTANGREVGQSCNTVVWRTVISAPTDLPALNGHTDTVPDIIGRLGAPVDLAIFTEGNHFPVLL